MCLIRVAFTNPHARMRTADRHIFTCGRVRQGVDQRHLQRMLCTYAAQGRGGAQAHARWDKEATPAFSQRIAEAEKVYASCGARPPQDCI